MIDPLDAQIGLYAKMLKLPTFANYRDVMARCDPGATFGDVLLELMSAENAARQENKIKRRLTGAGFPYMKTMDEFDMTQLNESVSPLFLNELASCQFVKDRRNVIMIGNPGRGKTHLAIALGVKACHAGYRVLFRNASRLSTELCEARDEHALGRLESTLENVDLLILDELGYISFNRAQSELLFKILADRTERTSTIVTSNLPYSRWTEFFEDDVMVAALIDRLTFRSYTLDMNGESYRYMATRSERESRQD